MKRREFVGLVGVGSIVPVAIASCTSQTKGNLTLSSPRRDGYQVVGTVSDLTAKGQILAEETALGKVLVISNPADRHRTIAVNPICPHAGCTVAWQQDQTAFVCPCHGSKFAADGQVLQGPANKPLPTYPTRVEGDSVLVKVS